MKQFGFFIVRLRKLILYADRLWNFPLVLHYLKFWLVKFFSYDEHLKSFTWWFEQFSLVSCIIFRDILFQAFKNLCSFFFLLLYWSKFLCEQSRRALFHGTFCDKGSLLSGQGGGHYTSVTLELLTCDQHWVKSLHSLTNLSSCLWPAAILLQRTYLESLSVWRLQQESLSLCSQMPHQLFLCLQWSLPFP